MKRKTDEIKITQSSTPVMSNPESAMETVNKYGTYEIQPTSDNDNKYPKIAQGLPKEKYRIKEDSKTGKP